ncbi:LPS-assembly protein LptD [Sinobacterium norvegicum]|uniref:LPS-assembly protein LptD n=1 Tax=Sinobacterium norvegicum TaxID=1641715 RepID=A0ABM9AFG4_9GAMM|nr:LPS-assembly protein LptD [Sinobacterium norvegicum]CAH0991477.1 LPS-assembly protein LptD [Sinobacterium norvegicum]
MASTTPLLNRQTASDFIRRRFPRKQLTTAITLILCSGQLWADSCGNTRALDWVPACDLSPEQRAQLRPGCNGMYVAPINPSPDALLSPDEAPTKVSADSTEITDKNSAKFVGDVVINQGSRQIFADEARADNSSDILELEGNVTVRDSGILMLGESGYFNSADGTGTINEAEFVIHQAAVRGDAEHLSKTGEMTTELYNSSYTRCAPGSNDWYMQATDIKLEHDEGVGTAKHAKLYIKDVPVAYIPYFTFPIDDRRKSGFLWPTIGTAKGGNGLDITVPYYFNLAENYDATLAPRYIHGRGLSTELETRYLNKYSEWVFSGAYLDDEEYEDTRWLVGVQEQGDINGLKHRIDYTKVSDDDYLNDISAESLDVKRQTHLDQKAELWYNTYGLTFKAKAQQYQTINDTVNEPYQMLPRLEVNTTGFPEGNQFNWLLVSEFTDFAHNDDNKIQGQRLYLEPGISYTFESRWGYLTPTAKVRSLHYQLDDETGNPNENREDYSPSTTAGMASVEAGLFFDRDLNLFGSGYTQTLEPRAFYLYSQYEDQSDNPLFDTGELTFSYNQLFRDTRFSGHDLIDDANQISAGVTTRFIDNSTGIERASFSLGQIYYFDERKVGLDSSSETDFAIDSRQSDIAGEASFRPTENLRFISNILWDTELNETKQGNITMRYNANDYALLNLSYRTATGDDYYVTETDGSKTLYKGDTNQSDISGVIPINDNWAFIGRYNYDHSNKRSLEEIAGIEYNSCCWKTQLVYQKGIDGNNEVEHGVYLHFQLKGLGGVGNGLDLDDSIVGFEEREEHDK